MSKAIPANMETERRSIRKGARSRTNLLDESSAAGAMGALALWAERRTVVLQGGERTELVRLLTLVSALF